MSVNSVSKAFVEENGGRRMESEMQTVYDELRSRNVPVELFTEKRLQRRQLALGRDTLVVGYVDTMLTAFRILGVQQPSPNDYPSVLEPIFHRRIWDSTVSSLTSSVFENSAPVFAKPKDRKKRFTGHVFETPDDLWYLDGAPQSTPLICSEVVKWLSEYRVYVNQNHIVGIKHYEGDPAITIDETIAERAVMLLKESGQGTAAYGLDLGVISSGETTLVEWNDGYSLGCYGLDPAIYTDLLIARWCEIMDT